MTKAETVFIRVNELVDAGTKKADAFKQLAEEFGQPLGSIRGAYYQWSKAQEDPDAPKRTRRRETTPEDALADARKALERAIESIDREVAAAEERAKEADSEAKALKATATDRKEAIQGKLEALA